jgi:WD40 repeat protein
MSSGIDQITLKDGALVRTFEGEGKGLCALAVTPDGKLLASAGDDAKIRLWSVQDGSLEHTLEGHAKRVNALAISPDGKLLVSASEDKIIRIWSLPDGKYLRSLMDLAANYTNTSGIQYKGQNESGQVVSYTLPCGSPIPAGAVCVCNCVPGSMSMPSGHTQTFAGTYCSCDTICTCNRVCTCESVGGSHYWHPN